MEDHGDEYASLGTGWGMMVIVIVSGVVNMDAYWSRGQWVDGLRLGDLMRERGGYTVGRKSRV